MHARISFGCGFFLCAALAAAAYFGGILPASTHPPGENREDHDGHGHAGHGHDEKEEPKGDEGIVRLSQEAMKAAGIRVARAEMHNLQAAVEATAVIRPNADRLAHVSPRVQGRVIGIHAALGSDVKEGDVLLDLDSVELGTAIADYHKSLARVEVARQAVKRIEEIGVGAASRASLLEARGNLLVEEAELRAVREKLLLLGLSDREIDTAGTVSTSRFPVRAPFSGTVIEKHATIGEVVDTTTNLFTIADLSVVWIVIDVYQQDLKRVRKDQEALITADGLPGETFVGRVAYIGDVFHDETRTFEARVEIPNPNRRLKPGMFVRAVLKDGDGESKTLCVPEDAVQRVQDRSVVFVLRAPGEFEARTVTLGERCGHLYPVLEGLEEGTDIAVRGGFILKSELLRSQIGHGHAH